MALAASKGLLLTVYHNRRWDGDFLTLRQLIEADALGPIALFQMRCVHPSQALPPLRSSASLTTCDACCDRPQRGAMQPFGKGVLLPWG
jgi:hypothetical protein